MKKETMLILGAGLLQKPAILASKKLGYNTVVIDANPEAEAIPLADSFRKIDLKDREGILEFAKELKETSFLKGIFTAGTDFSSSVSYAAENVGLPCHSFESTLNATIKSRMRQCFEKAGVPSPCFRSFSGKEITEDNVKKAVEELGFPCVVKPADNMGARGCRMIRSNDEVWTSVKIAAENSRSNTIILEEYMDGPEFSIDALICNGTMTITGFADRHIFYKPYFIETGHTMPSIFDEKKKLELIETFAKGASALGLTCGAAKADIKYTEKGSQIGEIAARLSGGYMSGWTFPYASGLNLTEQAILIASGKVPEELEKNRIRLDIKDAGYEIFDYPVSEVSAERAWISIPGKISEVGGMEEARKTVFVESVFPRPVKKGDEVDFPRNNVQKCGNVISKSSSYQQAVEMAQKAVSKVIVRLEPANLKTENFLSARCLSDENGFPPSAFSGFEKIKDYDFEGFIESGASVVEDGMEIPVISELLKYSEKDWTHRNALEVAEAFDAICSDHKKMERGRFWKALFRGGLQAAIYISDSLIDSEK